MYVNPKSAQLEQLIQEVQDSLVNNQQLHQYVNQELIDSHPEIANRMPEFELDEQLESQYYGLWNEAFLSIMLQVLARFSSASLQPTKS